MGWVEPPAGPAEERPGGRWALPSVAGAGAGPGHEPWCGGAATGGDDAGRSDHQAVLGSCGGPCSARRRGSGDGKGVGVSMGPASGRRIGSCLGLAEGFLGAGPPGWRPHGPSGRPGTTTARFLRRDSRRARGRPRPAQPRRSRPVLTPFDEYPIHQTAVPVAQVGDGHPDAYDRFWFNGYRDDLYFGIAMARYPNRGILDAAFSVLHDGVQRRCSPPVGRRSTPRSPPSGRSRSTSPTRCPREHRHRRCAPSTSASTAELTLTTRTAMSRSRTRRRRWAQDR